MAIYKCSEFAELCGIGKNTIAIYASRGKIIRSGEKGKFIDTSIPENALFLAKKLEENGQPAVVIPVATGVLNKKVRSIKKKTGKQKDKPAKADPAEVEKKPAKSAVVEPEDIKPDPEAQYILNLKREQEKSKLEAANVALQKARLDMQQKLGKILPTEIVKTLVKQLGHSFATNYRTGAEQILENICRKYDILAADKSEYKQNLVHIVNDVHERALKQTKAALQKIIEEQTIVKSIDEFDLE